MIDNDDGSADFSWTPGFDQAGDYQLEFSVTDDGTPTLSDSEKVTIRIANAPQFETSVACNEAGEPITLNYPDAQHFDFHICDRRAETPESIWSWSHGKRFTDMPTVLVIQPRERIEFVERWDGMTNDDVELGPGIYIVHAMLTTRDARSGPMERLQITE